MSLLLGASSSFLSPSIITIFFFAGLFAVLNIVEKGRWD